MMLASERRLLAAGSFIRVHISRLPMSAALTEQGGWLGWNY
ncbi:hypothetical protein WBG83_21735 [Paenibacillus sp. y28]